MREGTGHDAVPGDTGPDRDVAGSPGAEISATPQSGSPFGSAPVFLSEFTGPDLMIVSATPGTGAALGTGGAVLIGRRLADVIRGPEGEQLVAAIRRVYTTGNHAYDVRWHTPSGSQIGEPAGGGFSLSVLPVCQPDGSVGGVAVAGLARSSQPRGTGGRDGETAGASAGEWPVPPGTDAAWGSAVPAGLPVLPRVRLAARYLPARNGPGAGEAWIDAVVLPQRVIALMAGTARGATAWVAQLDPVTGELRYANAGQPRPLVCVPGGETTFLPPRGSTDGQPDGSAQTDLPPGGVLVLYLETAARAQAGDSTGDSQRRLADLAAAVMAGGDGGEAADTADRMCAAVAEQLAERSDGDAVLVLAAHRLREPAAGWRMEFPADPRALAGLREGLHGWLEGLGVQESDCTDVELAVWEAAVNATVHGRPGVGTGIVRVSAALDGAGSAVIRVSDRGRWRVGDTAASGHGWSGGRGLSVISQVSDELSISPGPGGTTVTMRRRLRRAVATGPAAG
jgi:anti-sigma regulatory factor (Ser/Thr protein kinase)